MQQIGWRMCRAPHAKPAVLRRRPSVSTSETTGLHAGNHRFPRRKTMVFSVQNDGILRAKTMVSCAQTDGFVREKRWLFARKSMFFGMKSAESVTLSPHLSPYLPPRNNLYINRLSRFGDRVTDIFTKIFLVLLFTSRWYRKIIKAHNGLDEVMFVSLPLRRSSKHQS